LLKGKDIKYLYGVPLLFVLGALLATVFEGYFFWLIPPAVVLLYFLIDKPGAMLYFLAFTSPISLNMSDRYSEINLSLPNEPLIILLMLGLVLKWIKSGSLYFPEIRNALGLILAIDLLWVAISAANSTMPIISAKFLLSRFWYIAVFFFFLTRFFKNTQRIKTFIWFLTFGILIVAVYTILNHSQYGFTRHFAYTASRPFLPEHCMYAAMLSFAVPPMLVFALHGHVLNLSYFTRIVAAVIMVVITVGVVFSFTRAAWLSLVVSFGIYFVLITKIHYRYVFFAFLLIIGAVLYKFDSINEDLSRNKKQSANHMDDHLKSATNVSNDNSNLERINRWNSAVRMFQERPVTGFGPGTYTFQYHRFQVPHQMTLISTNSGSLGNVHSEYLRPLSELGLPGFLIFLALLITITIFGFRQNLQLTGERKYLSWAAFLGLITYMVHGLLNNFSEFDKIAVPWFGFMAILAANEIWLKNNRKQDQSV
jgi:O-antigen ligase